MFVDYALSFAGCTLFANANLTSVAHANSAMLLQKAFFTLCFDKTFMSHLSMELLFVAGKSVFRINDWLWKLRLDPVSRGNQGSENSVRQKPFSASSTN